MQVTLSDQNNKNVTVSTTGTSITRVALINKNVTVMPTAASAVVINQNNKNVTVNTNVAPSSSISFIATDENMPVTLVQRNASGNFSAGIITATLNGNSSTANKLLTGRTISITGDIVYSSPEFDGNNNITAQAILATVNSNPGSYGSSSSIPIITVNDKGLITSISSATISSGSGSGSSANLATVATSGSYTDLINKPTLFSGSYTDLTNKPSLFSGSYTDLTNKPSIPAVQIQSDWSQVTNTALDYIKNKPSLFSGSYTDLTNKPTLFSGSYTDLTNKPSLFSGSYTDLTNKPTLFSGSYTDLTNKPSIPAVQIQSDWNQTTDTALDYIKNKPGIDNLVPAQVDNAAKFLTTNGSTVSWATVNTSETLVWTTVGNYRTLTGYKENLLTKTVRTAEFVSGVLRLTLATFTPILTSVPTPSTSLNWDVSATGFTVLVDNPIDITDQYVSIVASITATTGSIAPLASFTAGSKSVTPAGTIDWTQTFTNGASGYIRSTSTTISGGTAGASIIFNYYDGTSTIAYSIPATWSITWATPTLAISLSALSGSTFLQTYNSTNYTLSVTGITTPSNYSHSVTASGGIVSNFSGSGTFTFTTPIHKDNIATSRTASVTTTFTRPIAVTGTSYSSQLSQSTSSASATFTYPSLWIFTSSTSTVPITSSFITGTAFQSGVTTLGSLASSLSGFITNSSGGPQAFWFAVKSGGAQPTTFKTGASAGLLSDVTATIGNTVSLQPDSPPSGYVAVVYNLYGITLQNGSTYVSIA